MTEAEETVVIFKHELKTLLAVATAYLDAFTEYEVYSMPLGSRLAFSDVQKAVEKYGRCY